VANKVKVEICPQPFNPWLVLQNYEAQRTQSGKCGATACFIGTMRDYNEGDTVQQMWLEHYAGMTEQYLLQLAIEVEQRWQLLDSLILHRVGEIQCDQTIVLVAAWAGHRSPALEACRYLIEELKHRAPFWKRETLNTGQQRWVAQNTPSE
jgi:molybdopterin synthase catalytic subunit